MTTSQQISRLRVRKETDLPEPLRRFFEATRAQSGHLPNWLAAFALDDAQFSRLKAYLFPLLEGSGDSTGNLTRREREIIATLVSVTNGCSYCHTLHVHELGEFLGDHWLASRIALAHREVDEISEREVLLAELAVDLTKNPGDLGQERIVELRSAGLADEDIYEAVQIIGIINATNRITLALGVLPDPEIFAGKAQESV